MKKILFIFIVIGSIVNTYGQVDFTETDFPKTDYTDYRRYVTLGWDVNMPLSNKSDIGNVSYNGIRFGFREKINDHLFAGLDLNNFNYSNHIPRQTYYNADGSALTTDYFNYVYSYGATVSIEYYFSSEKRLTPFAGIGIGANYNSYKTLYNVYGTSDSSWGVLVRPEGGAILKLGSRNSWGIIASAHYDYSSSKSDMFSYVNFSNIGFRVGVAFFDF